ncbi:hypothetical protein FTX61_07905 [Nitriliruptoraceae bacterium ZYF776]|nr:hypothetical protein [Profundirhabdus halotolerans]
MTRSEVDDRAAVRRGRPLLIALAGAVVLGGAVILGAALVRAAPWTGPSTVGVDDLEFVVGFDPVDDDGAMTLGDLWLDDVAGSVVEDIEVELVQATANLAVTGSAVVVDPPSGHAGTTVAHGFPPTGRLVAPGSALVDTDGLVLRLDEGSGGERDRLEVLVGLGLRDTEPGGYLGVRVRYRVDGEAREEVYPFGGLLPHTTTRPEFLDQPSEDAFAELELG